MTQTFSAGQTLTAEAVNAELAFPTGSLVPFAGANAPTQTIGGVAAWLICDGAAVSRSTYATLFAALSTTYGAGDGSTTFNLPDLRGRMPIGAGNEGVAGNDTNRVRGVKGGDIRLTEHTHTGTVGSTNIDHTHNQTNSFGGSTQIGNAGTLTDNPNQQASAASTAGMNSNAVHTHTFTGGAHNRTQGNTSGDNMMPFLVTNYIIKT
jgi:microcystin-dependent protein